MAQFLGDIVFILELVTVAAGLFVLSIAKKEGSPFIKSSGLLLVIGGLVIAICSSFFYVKYLFQGEFDSAMPGRGMMGNMMNGRMGSGMMHGFGSMGRGMMDFEDLDPQMQEKYRDLNRQMQEFHRDMMDKYGTRGPGMMMYNDGQMGPGMMYDRGKMDSNMMNDTK